MPMVELNVMSPALPEGELQAAKAEVAESEMAKYSASESHMSFALIMAFHAAWERLVLRRPDRIPDH